MPAIPLKEAIEQLAQAVEKAAPDDLAEICAEMFPAKPRPEVNGATAGQCAAELARYIRAEIAPEEVVDLWNVVFPSARDVYYDEEDQALHHDERELRYAEQ